MSSNTKRFGWTLIGIGAFIAVVTFLAGYQTHYDVPNSEKQNAYQDLHHSGSKAIQSHTSFNYDVSFGFVLAIGLILVGLIALKAASKPSPTEKPHSRIEDVTGNKPPASGTIA